MNQITQTIKETEELFLKTRFAKGGGLCFECSDYEGMHSELLSLLSDRQTALVESVVALMKGKMGLQTLGGKDQALTDLIALLEESITKPV